MNYRSSHLPLPLMFCAGALLSTNVWAQTWYDALQQSKAHADLRMRYESVQQDNALDDARALTLRTLLGVKTGEYNGLSLTIELEDVRPVLGLNDYSVPQTGYKSGAYSVIADPQTTELDQGFVQYTHTNLSVKAGRQVIALDDHRFVGHVGWRQDRQTFDGITVSHQIADNMDVFYGYLTQRNRIFAEAADLDSADHLVNITHTSAFGTLTAYAYLLEVDHLIDNSLDTYGFSYSGSYASKEMQWVYRAEYATQSSQAGATDYSASYYRIEAGTKVAGIMTRVGYEVLGSDDGQYGFSTPLATLHKFNGWTDQFLNTPAQGLTDLSLTFSGSVAQGTWMAIYHDFGTDEADEVVADLGREIGFQYVRNFADAVNVGFKYATYSADDAKADTDKLWLWVATGF